MNCIGMDAVTTKFNEYDLREIGKEYRKSLAPGQQDVILPTKIGGSKVHLLIGIKNANLIPVLEKVLESWVAVFTSPFKDIFGSNKIFTGPHRLFTKANQGARTHAVYALRKEAICVDHLEEGETELCEERHFSISTDHQLGLTAHPHPLNEIDVADLGIEISVQFEERVDVMMSSPELLGRENAEHFCSSYKATVPIARMREILDIDNNEEFAYYRCPECFRCVRCRTSTKRHAISLQESVEQELIEKSVTLDYERKKVVVTYPWTKVPVEFLSTKHKGPNNYYQALKIYKNQCKKEDILKEKMRTSHAELVDTRFMVKLSEMPEHAQQLVNNAPFLHYHPWNMVAKEDSISTPIRLVVDPTMSGLNLILPKGENRIGSINQILIGNRADPYSWSSDITKLYNQLHLDESAYPYSLFLYNLEMDILKPPDVYVMVVAWYGVTPTGSQAGHTIERAVSNQGIKFPLAVDCLINRRYVDDLARELRAKKKDRAKNKIAQNC